MALTISPNHIFLVSNDSGTESEIILFDEKNKRPLDLFPYKQITIYVRGLSNDIFFTKNIEKKNNREGKIYIQWTNTELSNPGFYELEIKLKDNNNNTRTIFQKPRLNIRSNIQNEQTNEIPNIIEDEDSNNYTPTYTSIIHFVRVMLGEPRIKVELTDEQIETALQIAISKYFKYRSKLYGTYPLNQATRVGKGAYQVPPAVLKNISEIVDNQYSFVFDDDFEKVWIRMLMNETFYSQPSTSDLSLYYLSMNKIDSVKQLLGMKRSYEILDETLYIFPAPDLSTERLIIIYKKYPSIEQLSNNDWVKRYTLAYSKWILGNIRRRWGNSIPAGMENIQMDGDALVAEAREDINNLNEEVKDEREPFFAELM